LDVSTNGEAAATTPTADGAPASSDQPGKAEVTTGDPAASSGAGEPPAAKPKIAPELAALARREREATKRAQELKAKEDALTATEARVKPIADALERGDVRALLKLTGKPLTDIVEALSMMDDDEPAAPTPEEMARKAARDELDAREAAKKDADAKEFQARWEQKVQATTAELKRLAASDAERWERISVDDTVDAAAEAWDLIEKWHAETGEVLKLDQALDQVESTLLERHQRIASGKKLGTAAKTTSTEAATTTNGRAAAPTLSNHDGGIPTTGGGNAALAGLPEGERIAAVMKKLGIPESFA
jgi:hypothetical protein